MGIHLGPNYEPRPTPADNPGESEFCWGEGLTAAESQAVKSRRRGSRADFDKRDPNRGGRYHGLPSEPPENRVSTSPDTRI